jgi:Response regulator containing CheY-like receiver domain and AraC-type DNA-binding domain
LFSIVRRPSGQKRPEKLEIYPLETRRREQKIEIQHVQQQDTSASTSTAIDNSALTAIREAIRHFCERGDDQRLPVGHVRPPAELGLEVGYTSPSYFTKVFRRVTGVTPTECRSSL